MTYRNGASETLALIRRLQSSIDPDKIEAGRMIMDLMAVQTDTSGREYQDGPQGLDQDLLLEMAAISMKDLPEGPWLYRPNEFDDWGEVRSADGCIVARASLLSTQEELAAHRSAKTDPAERIGRFIARSRTLIPAMAKEIARLKMADRALPVSRDHWIQGQIALTGQSEVEASDVFNEAIASGMSADLLGRYPVSYGITHRHKKGGLYAFLSRCILESDLSSCVIYRSAKDGIVWVRPDAEFFDGRFTPISADWTAPPRMVLEKQKVAV